MRIADAVIGNSSSGIVEAPALKIPTVNIGTRQDGRLRATSIVDCEQSADGIAAAIASVLTQRFKATLPDTISVYGEPGASQRLAQLLCTLPLPASLKKAFYDV
jgi:UDP-N-acetylglucosamine 2-epimerase (non-hydrolysing)/GDP/UDP-N,N'-diacetylbacillosamine 2-epimerase (hydrolysing)